MKSDYPVIKCKDQATWQQWLERNHSTADGIWLQYYKKASGKSTVVYAEALDVALCFGWIDGQSKTYDDESYIQKFTPRRARSMWSKRNIEYVTRLTEAGRMTPAGQAEIDRAKADGRWDMAYDTQRNMVIPADFIAAVAADPTAGAIYASLNKSQLFRIGYNLQTAKKPDTRQRRFDKLLQLLRDGQKP